MSAAEHDDYRQQGSGPGAPLSLERSGKQAGEQSGGGADLSADAGFDRLLEQLEAEEGRATSGGVSQIFAAHTSPAAAPGGELLREVTPAGEIAASGQFSSFARDSGESKTLVDEGTTSKVFAAAATGVTLVPGAKPVVEAALSSSSATHSAAQVAPAIQEAPSGVAAPTAARPLQEQAGEFTRVFTQLPTPSSAPPAILAEVAPPTPALPASPHAGEFTQFFSALDPPRMPAAFGAAPAPTPTMQPGETPTHTSEAQKSAAVSSPATPTTAQSPALRAAETFQTGHTVPAPPAQAFASAAPEDTLAFAPPVAASGQAFSAATFAPSQSASRREPVREAKANLPGEPARPAQPPTGPGEFTAFLQSANASAPPAHSPLTDPPPMPALSAAPSDSVAQQSGFPAGFANPAKTSAGSGGFTELLQSLNSEGSQSPAGSKAITSNPNPHSQRRESSPYPADSAPLQAFAPRAADHAFVSPPFAPADQKPKSEPAKAGEFTELMQSLQAPNAKPSGLASNPSAQAPFFAAAPVSSGGTSEFTRIMQGSAARSAETPAPSFAPAPQSSGAAVGLPIAAPQAPHAPALPTAEAKTKLQAMLPWLLAANGALLLLLIALAVMFLRHKH